MMGEVIGIGMIALLFVGIFGASAINDLKGTTQGFAIAGVIIVWVMGGCYLITGGV